MQFLTEPTYPTDPPHSLYQVTVVSDDVTTRREVFEALGGVNGAIAYARHAKADPSSAAIGIHRLDRFGWLPVGWPMRRNEAGVWIAVDE